jgi:hypothetical protein
MFAKHARFAVIVLEWMSDYMRYNITLVRYSCNENPYSFTKFTISDKLG